MADIASCTLKFRPMSLALGRDLAKRIAVLSGVSPSEVGPFLVNEAGSLVQLRSDSPCGTFVFFEGWSCDSGWNLLEELLQDTDYPYRAELLACEIDGLGTESANRYREAVKKFPTRSRLLRQSRKRRATEHRRSLLPEKRSGTTALDQRFAWNARVARWRHALLAALADGRTKVEWILPLYLEDPAVPLADVVGGWRETWISEEYQGTPILRYDLDEFGWDVLNAVPLEQGMSRGRGKAPPVADPLEDLSAHAPLFAPARWSGRSKATIFAKKVTASGAWRKGNHDNHWLIGHRFLSTMPESLRSDPDFIGPFLFCHGLVALAFAAPAVQRDPDILRAVFSESWTRDGDHGSEIVDSLFGCLRDRASGLSGPASMPAGTSRRFNHDGREIWVYCLAQEESGSKSKHREMVTSLLVWCPEGENIGLEEDLDIAAIRIRSRLNRSGKTTDWVRVEYTLRTPLGNCLAEYSRLGFFIPEKSEGEDEFVFVDEEDATVG